MIGIGRILADFPIRESRRRIDKNHEQIELIVPAGYADMRMCCVGELVYAFMLTFDYMIMRKQARIVIHSCLGSYQYPRGDFKQSEQNHLPIHTDFIPNVQQVFEYIDFAQKFVYENHTVPYAFAEFILQQNAEDINHIL